MRRSAETQRARPWCTTEGLLVHASGTNAVSAEALVDIFIERDGAMFAEPAPGDNGRFVSLEGVTFYAG